MQELLLSIEYLHPTITCACVLHLRPLLDIINRHVFNSRGSSLDICSQIGRFSFILVPGYWKTPELQGELWFVLFASWGGWLLVSNLVFSSDGGGWVHHRVWEIGDLRFDLKYYQTYTFSPYIFRYLIYNIYIYTHTFLYTYLYCQKYNLTSTYILLKPP